MSETSSSFESINQQIKEDIAAAVVKNEPVSMAVQSVVNARIREYADMLVDARERIEKAAREIDKIRPDNITYNVDGTKASESYSKARVDELARVKGKRKKLVDAFEKALAGDYSDLKNLLAQKADESKTESETK